MENDHIEKVWSQYNSRRNKALITIVYFPSSSHKWFFGDWMLEIMKRKQSSQEGGSCRLILGDHHVRRQCWHLTVPSAKLWLLLWNWGLWYYLSLPHGKRCQNSQFILVRYTLKQPTFIPFNITTIIIFNCINPLTSNEDFARWLVNKCPNLVVSKSL